MADAPGAPKKRAGSFVDEKDGRAVRASGERARTPQPEVPAPTEGKETQESRPRVNPASHLSFGS